MGYLSARPTYLSLVDILKPKPIFRKIVSSIFRKSNLPNTPVVLFNAFRSQEPEGAFDRPELFFPPPEVATPPPNQCGFYGGFTSAILDIIEETQGQVTNVELARKAMEKTRMQVVPGLHCNDSHHAYVPFIC
ncbi:uncharacterized protein LOC130743034 [Lotus japonicus]|uniref:uncharacterized protein LOC130743034 n=1 Tax=Lotus japonicus TaxID=34305 RepID=UPI0025889B64|nr:uncharacterized protein LOC130743034 [Lotus japonicus]